MKSSIDSTHKRTILLLAIISRVLLFLTAIVSNHILGVRAPYRKDEALWDVGVPLVNLFTRWDSGYYITISTAGYAGLESYAFYPGYPVVLRLLSMPLWTYLRPDQATALVGFVTNNLLFLLATLAFFKLTLILTSNSTKAFYSTVFFIFFPSSVFYSAVYTESLFFTLIVMAFLLLENGYLNMSAFVAFVSGLVRPEAPVLSISLGLRANQLQYVKGLKRKALVVMAPFVGAVIYALYTWHQTGSATTILDTRASWRTTNLDLLEFLTNFATASIFLENLYIILVFGAILVALAYTVVLGRGCIALKRVYRFKYSEVAYMSYIPLLLFVYLLLGDIRSLPRHLSLMFPLHWSLAELHNHPYAAKACIIVFAFLANVGAILFANWYSFR